MAKQNYLELNNWLHSLFSCMRSLREPLLEAELKHDRKSSLWLFAVEIMVRAKSSLLLFIYNTTCFSFSPKSHMCALQVTLSAIKEPLPGLLFFSSLRKNILMDNNQFKEARACLAYLLFVQLITIDNFPAVFRWREQPHFTYRPKFTFTTNY